VAFPRFGAFGIASKGNLILVSVSLAQFSIRLGRLPNPGLFTVT
jgi:hypothetical protein